MKKSGIIFLGLLLIGMSVQAQKFYIRAGLGVAVSTATDYIHDYYYSSPNTVIITSKKQGLGTGLPFVLAAGYNLGKHFSLELGINYFYGFSNKQKIESSNSTYNYDTKWHGQMLSLVPAIVISLPINKLKPYARLGLKLGILNSVVSTDHGVNFFPDKSTAAGDIESKSKLYGGIAIGVQAAMGTDFVLSDRISVFGEIQVDGISYAPKHGKYTKYTRDGVDKMGSRTVKENKWNYVKEDSFPNEIPDNQPNERPKVNYLFGNVGLVIGVKVNL